MPQGRKSQVPGSQFQSHRATGSRVPEPRVSGSPVSGLRVPGPGSQVLILDYVAKNRPYHVCHDFYHFTFLLFLLRLYKGGIYEINLQFIFIDKTSPDSFLTVSPSGPT